MHRNSRSVLHSCVLTVLSWIISSTTCFSTHTFMGKYLSEHEFKSPRVEDWMGCIQRCHNEPGCVSYNYHIEKNACLLNDHGIEKARQVDEQLLDFHGWVFQQLRPVTKLTHRVQMKTPCPCNCGSKDQCYPEPGIGDVPGKAARSCKDILNRRGRVPDGGYYLKQNTVHRVYCQMTPIPECDDSTGGWTLVMKIDGNSTTFKYDAKFWKHYRATYQEEHGSDLSERETKLKTYFSLSFQEMCLGMKTRNSTTKWLKKDQITPATTMFPIFSGDLMHFSSGPVSINDWKQLLPESELDTNKTDEGFNKKSSGGKVRLGILGFHEAGSVATSYIGFGTGGPGGRISCGNFHNHQNVPAFGYILVR